MAEIILYLGASGVGKSTAIRTLNPKETVVVAPNSKGLPFQGWRQHYKEGQNLIRTNKMEEVYPLIKYVSDSLPHIKTLILDDFFHFMSARIFSPTFLTRTSGNDAFAKWNEMGADVFNMVFSQAKGLREDLYIVINAHTEVDDSGKVTIKTAGKLLDKTIDIPSYLTYIIHGIIRETETGVEYLVQTNWHSIYHAKTPLGCFKDLYVPNDLNAILNTIKTYEYGEQVPVQEPATNDN